MSIKDEFKRSAIMKAYDYMDRNPEKNIPKLIDELISHDRAGMLTSQASAVQQAFSEKDGNWYRLIMDLFQTIDPEVRRRIVETFAVNATLIGGAQQKALAEEYGCNIPWAILMDPTSACNLHCTGCWAAEYGNRLNLSYEELDDIIRQGKALGCYFYLYSGGEPLVRKQDILRLCEAHPDCAFTAFTNGTLIDEAFADAMLRVKNFVPAISVEGFAEATDDRRGAGTFDAVRKAMKILREKKLPFGVSCCYTAKNVDVIGSEAYFDAMIEWGAKFCWLFTYMPVGKDAVPELMVNAEQRKFMYEQVRAFRKTKPIFTMDFWNDGEFSGGCIAGGRRFLHINAGGDIEPCAFVHYADSNIRTQRLLEALKNPLFMAYHHGQPFNKNMLRPCPVLDNPGILANMVAASGARSTDCEAPESAEDYCAKCKDRAEAWAPVAEELWQRDAGKRRYQCPRR